MVLRKILAPKRGSESESVGEGGWRGSGFVCRDPGFKLLSGHRDIDLFRGSSLLQIFPCACKQLSGLPLARSLPTNIVPYFFILHKCIAQYNTRFSEIGNFNIKHSRTNHLKDSFSIFGARIWNSIPQSIRILPKHKFKVPLHQLLLRILEMEDTYVAHLL